MANNNTYCVVPADVAKVLFRIPLYQRLLLGHQEKFFS